MPRASPSPGLPACDPYRPDRVLHCYVARGVERLPLGGKINTTVELFATDDACALARASTVMRSAEIEVRRLPLPPVVPPGFSDDAQRLAWSEARDAYYATINHEYWAERAAADGRAA